MMKETSINDFIILCNQAGDVVPQRSDNLLGERLETLLYTLPLRGAILCIELAAALNMSAGELIRAVDALQHSGTAHVSFAGSDMVIVLRSSRYYFPHEN